MFDISENEGFELIKAGDYEAFVSEVTAPTNINGKMVSNISYKIREDIDQPYKNREIKFDYFSDADNMKWKIASLAKALGFFENPETSKDVNGVRKLAFNSFEDFLNACLNKPLLISVSEELYVNKKGEEKTKNTVIKYDQTKSDVKFEAPVTVEVNDTMSAEEAEELPF